ncbi:MAG: nicotinate phosphoribosyltransferase [Sedimentisphaerales bacterium]|nr:nicotinate phosphoribosyltransferase [Sedimentisphaerales bacterium]
MTKLEDIYRPSLGLLTDLYQLTMAYGYWKLGRGKEEAVFTLSFRDCPFQGGYAVACGLAFVIDYLNDLRFEKQDLEYLGRQEGNDGKPLFDPAFLEYLGMMEFSLDVDAMPEGTVVFAHQPLVRIQGPLLQCQIIETSLLNLINFQTLIATKSARICQATEGEPVLEFGLRRAQGIDGALAASRAAYVGGCVGTSNVLAGRLFDIPIKGTHAHSWVMSFPDELTAFEAYAEAMPNNCIFLVDTYDTLQGVKNAIQMGRKLREMGHAMIGIRLDSGDLTYLSMEARRLLDEAGFSDAKILASNDLDEFIIRDLKDQGAKITIWGVGTRLATGHGQSALGGVYKLSAIRANGNNWQYKVKLSEDNLKINMPGILQVRRFSQNHRFVADMMYDLPIGVPDVPVIVDPADTTRRKRIDPKWQQEDLLVPIFRKGRCVYEVPPLVESRARTLQQLEWLHPGIRRLLNPHRYPAGMERQLYELRQRLILEARGFSSQ